MQAIILSIGDELVLGQTVDTNSAWLSARLAERGVLTREHHTVADDRAAIADAIARACSKAELVIISGGLGPTDDDLTRQGLADAMGVELICDQPSVEAIRAFFTRRSREMPERNKVQAMHPAGTQIMPNRWGTAPGIAGRLGLAQFFVVPGVPVEMTNLFLHSIAPKLDALPGAGRTILTAKVNTYGIGESDAADLLGDLMRRDRNPLVGTTVSGGMVTARIRSEFPSREEAQRELDDTLARVEAALGPIAFSRDDRTLAQVVLDLLRQRSQTLATAESCTGGLVGAMLTDIPGSSAVYRGGWVTYANEMKASQLGVSDATLATHGAVSEATVRAMAAGALRCADADHAVAITGVAGPTGGTADKPVGTVWIGLAHGNQTEAVLMHLGGDRDVIRQRAALAALQLLRLHLLGEPLTLVRWGQPASSVAPAKA
jgi:nicotinamide-nucleotide amidase